MAEYRQFRGGRDRVGSRKKMCILLAVRLELVGVGGGIFCDFGIVESYARLKIEEVRD